MNNLENEAISKIVQSNSNAKVLTAAATEMRNTLVKLTKALSESDMGTCGVLAKTMEIDVNIVLAVARDMSPLQ